MSSCCDKPDLDMLFDSKSDRSLAEPLYISSMPAHVRPNEISAKSLFTAVLYSDFPESSASSSTGERSIYLKQIRREHLARASMEEVGSQLPDATDSKSITKVAQLTERAKCAYSEANGNSADGRWTFLSDLLRLHCTRGGRNWIGTNTSVEAPTIPEHLCILPEKSNEWRQLERKRKEEEDVKSRVQRWITTAEFDPLTPETTIVPESIVNEQIPFTQASLSVSQRPIQTRQTTLKSAYDQANAVNKFGFPVVKRSHVGKGKGDVGAFRRSSPPLLPSQQFHVVDDRQHFETTQQSYPSPAHSVGPSSVHNAECILETKNPQPLYEQNESEAPTDVPASKSLPPSFLASQIHASTPRREVASEVQNQPTMAFEYPAPPSTNGMEISRLAVDNSHLSEPLHLPDSHSRKRVRSLSPGEREPVLKRARVSQQADRFSPPAGRHPNVKEMPSTPPNRNLPRLTDLIASAKCQKPSPRKKSSSSKLPPPPMENVTDITTVSKPTIHHQDEAQRMETTKEPTPPTDAVHRNFVQSPSSEREPYPPMAEVNTDVRVEAKPTSALESEALCPEQIPENLLKDRRMKVDSEKFPALSDQSARQPDSERLDTRPAEEEALAVPESRPQTPDPPKSPPSHPLRFPSAEPGSSQDNLEVTSYNLYGLDNCDNPSPAKSLSSLAGSDSGSGSDGEDGEDTTAGNITVPQDFDFVGHEFNPPFTSTQKSGLEIIKNTIGSTLPSDLLSGRLPSTSQLQAEINSQVDEFDKFMEADLGFDPVAL